MYLLRNVTLYKILFYLLKPPILKNVNMKWEMDVIYLIYGVINEWGVILIQYKAYYSLECIIND